MAFLGFWSAAGAIAPALPSVGDCYFDTTQNQPLWWNGTSWTSSVGTSGTVVIQKLASGPVSGGRVVRSVGGAGTDVAYADAFTLSDFTTVLGVSQGAALSGDPVQIVTAGQLGGFGGLIAGDPVWCGPSGNLVQAEDPAWAWSKLIGYAESTVSIIVQMQPATVLL